MRSESSDRRPTARPQHGGLHLPEPEQLQCPRCDSTNTKFCYYNNYNLSQPRHFCKSCRRYWTRGGTLRNVPVGGGSRKNPNKRLRTAATTPSSSSSTLTYEPNPLSADPITIMAGIKTGVVSPVNLNENVHETESFASLLNPHGSGLFALGGYGPGFREIGFGLGAGVWNVEDVGGGVSSGGGGASGPSAGCNAWQMGSVEGGLADGDGFGWPDLAISTPGKGLK
ncbi:hypothetical protein NMG60_11016354 [Bertholletia excelsa]